MFVCAELSKELDSLEICSSQQHVPHVGQIRAVFG